jgi:hypothetical protein
MAPGQWDPPSDNNRRSMAQPPFDGAVVREYQPAFRG